MNRGAPSLSCVCVCVLYVSHPKLSTRLVLGGGVFTGEGNEVAHAPLSVGLEVFATPSTPKITMEADGLMVTTLV